MLLNNKNIVVTGCNRGIGQAMLKVFAENGANLWSVTRQDSIEHTQFVGSLAEKHQVTIRQVFVDFSEEEQVKYAAKKILQEKLPIDGLVNNAGLIETGPCLMTKAQVFRSQLEINYVAPMVLSQMLARPMLKNRQGSIVNVSSSAVIEGNEGRIAYAGAKSALATSTRVMARELGGANIRVNAIAPGLTQTEMMSESTSDDALHATVARSSLKRVGQPEEIARVALFLLSDLSTYITGQIICADGGL